MQNNVKKIAAIVIVIIFCAAATIAGLAISAATHYNAALTTAQNAADLSRPALKDGVWQAVYEDGHSMYFFINEADASFSLIDPDLGIGIPSRYEYISTIGMYKLQIGYEGNECDWRVIDNDGSAATVSDENGDLIILYYISDQTADSYRYYNYEILKEMARLHYEEIRSTEGVAYTAALEPDGSNAVTISVEKDGVRLAYYTVDIQTATGVDNAGKKVDLSLYEEQAQDNLDMNHYEEENRSRH